MKGEGDMAELRYRTREVNKKGVQVFKCLMKGREVRVAYNYNCTVQSRTCVCDPR